MALTLALLAVRGMLFWLLASATVDKARAHGDFEALLGERFHWSAPAARRSARLLVAVELAVAAGLFVVQ